MEAMKVCVSCLFKTPCLHTYQNRHSYAVDDCNEGVRVGAPIAAISAGGFHTLLLDLDGAVFAVGENFRGQVCLCTYYIYVL